jgi:hypothetical protein
LPTDCIAQLTKEAKADGTHHVGETIVCEIGCDAGHTLDHDY